MDFETFIPVHPKDFSKLPYVVRGIRTHTLSRAIHLCAPDPSLLPLDGLGDVIVHADHDVLPFDTGRFRFRSNWVYQQFLKLFQNVTGTDYYLGMDADMILNSRMPMFENGHPLFTITRPQPALGPYFDFSRTMIGVGQTCSHTFLSDFTLYNRTLILEMLNANGYTDRMDFLERAVQVIDGGCFPADAELYGSWVWVRHPDLYHIRQVSNYMGGRYDAECYNAEDIERVIGDNANADTISVHSWEGVP